eukprot:COSAG05_NODE_258_length_12741_cov_168.778279_6_plen_117_part_00
MSFSEFFDTVTYSPEEGTRKTCSLQGGPVLPAAHAVGTYREPFEAMPLPTPAGTFRIYFLCSNSNKFPCTLGALSTGSGSCSTCASETAGPSYPQLCSPPPPLQSLQYEQWFARSE